MENLIAFVVSFVIAFIITYCFKVQTSKNKRNKTRTRLSKKL